MRRDDEVAFHWGWVTASAAAGAVFIVAAHVGDLCFGWPQITTGTLANIGAAFVIAFLLFIVERRFTRNIRRTVAATARAVVEENTRTFNDRIDNLEAHLDERRKATEQAQNAAVKALAFEMSRDAVWDALEEADRVGAIRGGLTLQGNRKLRYPLVTFELARRSSTPTYWGMGDEEVERRLYVSATVQPRRDEIGVPVIEAVWDPTKTAADIVDELDEQLRRRGFRTEAKALEFPFAAEELQRGLRLAIDDQQVVLGEERLAGPLVELLSSEWVITEDGVQNLDTGFSANWNELGFTNRSRRPQPRKSPPVPEGVDEATWDFVVERLHNNYRLPGLGLF